MSISNSKTRRAEPRTAADLKARGFKTVGHGRYGQRGLYESMREFRNRCPIHYSVVRVDEDARTGRNSRSLGAVVAHGNGTRSEAYLPLKSGIGTQRKPMGTFESIVAAAHALLDAQGVS